MSARPDAGQRLRRLLAVLTWLARVTRAPVSELATRFGMQPEDLVADLELAACCGLPPYTPDQLMEIMVDDEEVVANLGEELARPRRLTPAEGFALAAAARAILATPGAVAGQSDGGALQSALAKLEAALGAGGAGADGLRVELGDAPHLADVRRAVEQRRQMLVRYYSLSSDEETERVIDPVDLVSADGHWYLDAYCQRAGGMRRFRLDRLVTVSETGRRAEPPSAGTTGSASSAPGQPAPESQVAGSAVFVPGPDATVATVVVDGEGRWLVEAVPTLRVTERGDGRLEVDLAVASTVWFERLLLRLGSAGEVLSPPSLAGTGRAAAKRLLERYGEEGADAG